MKNESLIEQLSSNLVPTKALKSRTWALLSILGISILSGIALLGICGHRSNLDSVARESRFYAELLLLFLATVGSFRWATLSSIPGVLQKPHLKLGLLIGIGILMVTLIAQHSGLFPKGDEWQFFVKSGSHCSILISTCAFMPMVWGYREMKQGACTWPRLSLALIGVGSFSAAILVQHMICPSDDLWHLLVWHLGMLPIAVIIALALGRKVLKL